MIDDKQTDRVAESCVWIVQIASA